MNFAAHATQGRAKSATEPWSTEELEALLTLERERHLDRTVAAEYVRNGILTLEDYDKAQKKGIVPQSAKEMVETVKAQTKKALKGGKTK